MSLPLALAPLPLHLRGRGTLCPHTLAALCPLKGGGDTLTLHTVIKVDLFALRHGRGKHGRGKNIAFELSCALLFNEPPSETFTNICA